MTNFGFRKLVLPVIGAAFVSSPLASETIAEDVERIGEGRQAAWTVKIGPQRLESSESTGIVISPSRQSVSQSASGEPEVPILVAPNYDEEPEEKSNDRKAGKKPAKGTPRKAGKSPVATETASQKAREEWQKKKPIDGEKRQPKSKNPAEKNADKSKNETTSRKSSNSRSKAASSKAALEARKRAMAAQAKARADKVSSGAKPTTKTSTTVGAARAQAMFAKRAAGLKDSRSYREIYNSIPFSRAEYDANPGYRHLATMEIMLGQLHPIIVAPPAPPQQETKREITVRFLPAIRPGYRPYSVYPWH